MVSYVFTKRYSILFYYMHYMFLSFTKSSKICLNNLPHPTLGKHPFTFAFLGNYLYGGQLRDFSTLDSVFLLNIFLLNIATENSKIQKLKKFK